jgi:hypothetical protein
MPPRAVSDEDISDWLTPTQALSILTAMLGSGSAAELAKETLLGRLQGNDARAIAARTTWENKDKADSYTVITPISAQEWRTLRPGDLYSFWRTGDLVYLYRVYGHDFTKLRHFDVRFHPDDVRAIVANQAPTTTPAEPEPRPTSNRGGRPAKGFWDDFWIDICRQIYEGDLKPKRQADLERAMHEWVTNHGHDVGETTIKAAAKKLFAAWGLGSKT